MKLALRVSEAVMHSVQSPRCMLEDEYGLATLLAGPKAHVESTSAPGMPSGAWPKLFGQLTIKDIAVELTPYTLLIIGSVQDDERRCSA